MAKASVLEQLLFSLSRWDTKGTVEGLTMFENLEDDSDIPKEKVKAVMRMLLLSTKSESSFLGRKHATGPVSSPYEALVVSHQERFIVNSRILRFSHAFIPKARAPPVSILPLYAVI